MCLEKLREGLSGSCEYCRNLRVLLVASFNSDRVPLRVEKIFYFVLRGKILGKLLYRRTGRRTHVDFNP